MVKIKLGYSIGLPVNSKENYSEYSNENINLIKYFAKNFYCVQIMFSKSIITDEELQKINYILKNYKLVYVHASYQINIGSELIPSKKELFNSSLNILLNEIKYAIKINARGIVLHMGKNVKNKYDYSIIYNNMVKFIIELFKNLKKNKNKIQILLETPAGQSGEMCWDILEFINFIKNFSHLYFYPQLNICLDTCHLFKAGIDINDNNTITNIHKILKPIIKKIKLIHLNDSYHPVGSKIDRHAQIGKGYIKVNQLIKFIYPFRSIPMILETNDPLIKGSDILYEKQINLINNSDENIKK